MRSKETKKPFGAKQVPVREVIRSTVTAALGSGLQELASLLKKSEEVVIVANAAMLHDRTVFLGSLMMIQAILLNQL